MIVKKRNYFTDILLFKYASGDYVSVENPDYKFADFLTELHIQFDDSTTFVRLERYVNRDSHTIEIHCFGSTIRVTIYNITLNKLIKFYEKEPL